MAKKMTKKEAEGIFSLVVIGGVIWVAVEFTKALGGIRNIAILGGILLVVYVGYKFISWNNKKKSTLMRRQKLMLKYKDAEIVDKIMSGSIWQGQTAVQVSESLGGAEDIDQKILKTKKKEIWKYGCDGANRYRLRITLENDIVIGWESR